MKKCQVCGNENPNEMRFCLECGTSLPDSPMVINLQDSATQKQSQINTASYEKSMETRVGGRNTGLNNYVNTSSPRPKSGGKIFLVLGGIVFLLLMFLTAGGAIIAYNWDEIVKIFDKPRPTPPPRTPTPTPTTPTPTPKTPTPTPTTPTPTPKSDSDIKTSFDRAWVDYNVTENGRNGMRIHVKFSVKNLKGVSSYVAVYFQKKDGTNLTTSDSDFRSENGNLAVFSSLKPAYDDAVYNDVQLFMPYEELGLKRGKHDLKMDIDLIRENGDKIEHLTYHEFWYEEK